MSHVTVYCSTCRLTVLILNSMSNSTVRPSTSAGIHDNMQKKQNHALGLLNGRSSTVLPDYCRHGIFLAAVKNSWR